MQFSNLEVEGKMMEKTRKNEYTMILVINLLLALYTSIFLYGSPYALYNPFSIHTLLSVLGWTLYAGSLYNRYRDQRD